jgi:hypothetical protein
MMIPELPTRRQSAFAGLVVLGAVIALLAIPEPPARPAEHSSLRAAYEACERHIASQCSGTTCNSSCAFRPGAMPCGGAYQWQECNKIAERWLASPERHLLESSKAAAEAVDARDREIVRQAQ